MDTSELIGRMTKLGWKMPKQLAIEGAVAMYDEQPEDGGNWFTISDQHARDLLCADFERWLIGKGLDPSTEHDRELVQRQAWGAEVFNREVCDISGHSARAPDKLEALVSAAEHALKEQAR